MTELTCRDFVEFIAAHVEGELASEERTAFEEHLAECDDCAAYLESYRRTITLGKAAFEAEGPLPTDVPQGLIDAILRARQRAR